MKRTLFQTIIKESIQEGGNAVPSAQPVRGDLAEKEEPQGEPAYSQAIREIHDLYRRIKKTED